MPRFLAALGEHALRFSKLLELARDANLPVHGFVVIAHGVGDLGEIALAALRHDGDVGLGVAPPDRRNGTLEVTQALSGKTA